MKINVIRSAVIDAPIDRVWAVLRDFGSHERWHPAVTRGQIENGLDGDVVGCVRRFSLSDGAELREQLLRHSDRDRSYTYCILDSSLPLFDNVSTLSLKPVTDGNQTFLDWRSRFRTSNDRAAQLENLVGRNIFEAGLTGLRMFLAEQAAPPRKAPDETESTAFAYAAGEHLPAKVVVVGAGGDPEVMSMSETTVPPPDPQQVRIRQTVIAVNYLDIAYRRGGYAGFAPPGTPGVEGVGVIVDAGEQVNGLFPGDRVAYVRRTPGAYAEIIRVDARDCIPVPNGVSDIEASMLLKGASAAILLGRVFRVVPGATILIQSIAGGPGHLLTQWAKSLNLNVIGTVSTPVEAKFIRDLGCDRPILLAEDKRLPDEVMRITNGHGVDYLVHGGGSGGFDDALACLSRFGHCAVIDDWDGGDPDGRSIPFDVKVLKQRSLTLSAPVFLDYFDDKTYLQRIAHQFFAKIQSRAITPAVEIFPLEQAKEAHQRIESRLNMGAISLTPEN